MPFAEIDVSRDQLAAQEMVRRSGQMGVPVTADADTVIVGFDRPRLEQLASKHAPPRLGLLVKDDASGVLVGGTRPGSPAETAGFQAGDLVEEIDGQMVDSAADVEHLAAGLARGALRVVVRRGLTLETLHVTRPRNT